LELIITAKVLGSIPASPAYEAMLNENYILEAFEIVVSMLESEPSVKALTL
jgi:hypothetical protein